MIFSKLRTLSKIGSRWISTSPKLHHGDGNYKWRQHYQRLIGNREQVGYGWNGEPWYHDWSLFPFPAIRFRESTPELKALHEKAKGDWKQLTLEEKKCLYRASFCQTFAEFKAPTGDWKVVIGGTLLLVSLGLWVNLFMYACVYSQTPIPPSFSEEAWLAQMRRQIDLHMNPIQGIGSEWDYDTCDWKFPKKWRQLPNPFRDPCTGEPICNDYSQ